MKRKKNVKMLSVREANLFSLGLGKIQVSKYFLKLLKMQLFNNQQAITIEVKFHIE